MLGSARFSTVRSSPTTSTLAAIAISAHQRRDECCESSAAPGAGTVVEVGWDTMRVTVFWMSQENESYYQNTATLTTPQSNPNRHLERTLDSAPPPPFPASTRRTRTRAGPNQPEC